MIWRQGGGEVGKGGRGGRGRKRKKTERKRRERNERRERGERERNMEREKDKTKPYANTQNWSPRKIRERQWQKNCMRISN